MRSGIARVLTLGFSTVMCLAPMVQAATAPVGTLSGDDKVKLNGKNLTSAQLALPGDIVEAPGAATGTLHLGRNGVARLTATARASVERSGQEVWVGLQSGFVAVGEGDQPMSVRAHGGKITASAGAVFNVAQVKNTTYITAVKGSAIISDGGLPEPESVKEGTTVTIAFLEHGPLGYDPQGSGKASAQTCNDPCKKDGSSKECTDFKALKKQCTPMRKACAKDSTTCAAYGQTCKNLAGCPAYPGVAEAAGATGAAGAASASAAAGAAAAASAAAGAGAAAGASIAATTAAAAAAAAAGIAGATVAATTAGTTTATSTTVSPH